jgi:serine/threonine-protein phosphatase 2A regulatory subunit A
VFADLSGDHTPMVRRAAAEKLGDFATGLVKDVPGAASATNEWTANQISKLIPLFTQLAMDEQDSVRFKTVDNCIKLAALFNIGEPPDGSIASTAAANPDPALTNAGPDATLTYQEVLGRIYSTALSCCADSSWRMRWSLVAKLDEFLAVIGASPRLVIAFQGLLADPDTEVRTAACSVVGKVGLLVGVPALVNQILPALGLVADDASDHVRVALAGSACTLSTALGREQTISRLLPLLLQLLRDTNSEVRLNIVAHLGEVNSVIGVELLAQSLLPTIFELARDGKWRVRQAIVDHMPMLATQLGVAMFNERLVSQVK